MAKVPITISVDTDATTYWIALDDQDIEQGEQQVEPGEHMLVWWMMGASGSKMTVTVTGPNGEIAKKESKIPAGKKLGGGLLRFTV